MEWVDTTIMPTPGAVGKLIMVLGEQNNQGIIGVDIGGATTDVFSNFEDTFTRTVSANLGMSYSICNVLEEQVLTIFCAGCPLVWSSPRFQTGLQTRW